MDNKGDLLNGFGRAVAAPQHDQFNRPISSNHSSDPPGGCLVLTRRIKEAVMIGDDVRVWVHGIDRRSDQVKLAFLAPKATKIYREEIYQRIQSEPHPLSASASMWDQIVSHAPNSLEVRTAVRMRENGATLAETALYLSLHLLNTLQNKADQVR